jgi:hypothetical protein
MLREIGHIPQNTGAMTGDKSIPCIVIVDMVYEPKYREGGAGSASLEKYLPSRALELRLDHSRHNPAGIM